MKTRFLYISLFALFTLATTFALAQNPDRYDHEYMVVINHEEQYSIWLFNEEPPTSWKATDFHGDLRMCHDYIEEVWTDMRPLSIREMELSENTKYAVIINHEEQYSIWPVELDLPENWELARKNRNERRSNFVIGTLRLCTDHIEEVWTDMRPLSLRKRLE